MTLSNVQALFERDTRVIADSGKIRFFPLVVDHAEGSRIVDADGKSYLDFTSAWALANTGYSAERVRDAVIAQIGKSTFAGLISALNAPAVALAEKLVDLTPGAFEKDVVVLGKSLGGGLPLSAVVAHREILDGGFSVFTATGTALCCAAELAAVETIEADRLVERSQRSGDHLRRRLDALASRHPLIGDVRGLGMFQGVELVRDRNSKEPAAAAAAKVVYRAFELGLLVYYVGMFSNVLEITPPLIMTEAEIDEGVEILDRALTDVEAGRVDDALVAPFAGW